MYTNFNDAKLQRLAEIINWHKSKYGYQDDHDREIMTGRGYSPMDKSQAAQRIDEREKELRKELEDFEESERRKAEASKLEKMEEEKPVFSWERIKVYSDGRTNLENPAVLNTTRMPYKILQAFGNSLEEPPLVRFDQFEKKDKKKVKQAIADLKRHKAFQDIFQALPTIGYRLKGSSK